MCIQHHCRYTRKIRSSTTESDYTLEKKKKSSSFFTKEIGVMLFCLLQIPDMAFSTEDCAEPFFCPETLTRVCTSQNGQSLSPATPPGGRLTLWAGWSGATVCWWCITRTCRRLCSRSSASSRHFWTSHRPRRGCSALTATRTATSSARGPSTPPSTRSLLPWGRWSTPSLTLWTRHSRAGTLADFHRSTSPDDGLRRVRSALTAPAEDCGTETPTRGWTWQNVRGWRTHAGIQWTMRRHWAWVG